MKRSIIMGAAVCVLGLLIGLGPQFLLKGCAHGNARPLCFWSLQAEIGIGLLIAALGICMFAFDDPKTQLGLAISTFLAGIVALFIPYSLIGGCKGAEMACRRIAFPAITVESVILVLFSALIVVYIELKKPKAV
ncbi:MAG: DUF4418 family protein [Treponema sp.]|jgi:hypothetical protein|nr:DUF4418 family protein [Treponema sp.]